MDHSWIILSGVWSAVIISYLVLYIIATGRLRGPEKKRSGIIFWVIAGLTAMRISIWLALGRGLVYRFAVLFVGIAAGIAALDLARVLITQKPNDGANEASEERIQSLRLN